MNDNPNQWKGSVLFREKIRYLIKNNLVSQEVKDDYLKFQKLKFATYANGLVYFLFNL